MNELVHPPNRLDFDAAELQLAPPVGLLAMFADFSRGGDPGFYNYDRKKKAILSIVQAL